MSVNSVFCDIDVVTLTKLFFDSNPILLTYFQNDVVTCLNPSGSLLYTSIKHIFVALRPWCLCYFLDIIKVNSVDSSTDVVLSLQYDKLFSSLRKDLCSL